MYQVGFGDCFLMTYFYKGSKNKKESAKHVLIDFGSSEAPSNLKKGLMQRVAADIEKTTGKKLDIVVATHRHSDHVSGFETKKDGKGTGDMIRACNPELVLMPWTEDPDAQKNATKPTQTLTPNSLHLRSLMSMNEVADGLIRRIQELPRTESKYLVKQMAFIGEVNLKNKSAVKNLITMGDRRRYLYFGANPSTSEVLPGVKVYVLGPPTLEQSDTIKKQRSKDEAEFWQLMGSMAGKELTGGTSPFPTRLAQKNIPPASRWIARRVRNVRAQQLLSLVRILDSAMNNTSLILLFKAGNKSFLFPGDAQIENWSYALEQIKKDASLKKLLESVDLYKVGHHGSLNATPRTLWNMFQKKGPSGNKNRLHTVLSTMSGKHGNASQRTEVPRKTLVEELEKSSDLKSTQDLKKKTELYELIEFKLQ
jgi:hypothetical protein